MREVGEFEAFALTPPMRHGGGFLTRDAAVGDLQRDTRAFSGFILAGNDSLRGMKFDSTRGVR